MAKDGSKLLYIPEPDHHSYHLLESTVDEQEVLEIGRLTAVWGHDMVRFSPDGNTIYYVSTEDGHACIYARRLSADRKSAGAPVAVQHLHEANTYGHPHGMWVGADKIVLLMNQGSSNIWLLQPPRSASRAATLGPMPLPAGTKLGPYEVIAPLGTGGMGEVYRAADTTLARQVAVKVLPEAFAHDADRLARLEREAKTLAALNHRNIAQVFGLITITGTRALVMELVEGPTLDERIAHGPMPLDEVLATARQIADALDAAHERGIVHRDLKPANIKSMPDGTVKVLDFGLAKALDSAGTGTASPGPAALTQSPTMSAAPMTVAGVVLGTPAYMSPEQARGLPVDKRTDIWAFGCVVYEMATGHRLFDGETTSDMLSNVLTREPDWDRTPAKIRPLLQACLQRDLRQRLRDIGDAWRLVEQPNPAPASRKALPWVTALTAAAIVTAILFAWSTFGRPAAPLPATPIRLALDLGRGASFASDFPAATISPAGTQVVFASIGADGISRLSRRRLDQSETTPLPGTEEAVSPFFSPSGEWVAFFAAGKLKKMRLDGGTPIAICDAPAPRGGGWGDDGRIVFAPDNRSRLFSVPADGGPVTPVTELLTGELSHRWPYVLPGSRAVLFTVGSVPGNYAGASVAVASLVNNPGWVKKILLPNAGMSPRYLATGHLGYVANGTLFAVPFDPDALDVRGNAAPVLDDLSTAVGFGSVQFAVSPNGVALYRSGRTTGRRLLAWLGPDGKTASILSEPANYQFPRVSPDGRRLAVAVAEDTSASIWVHDWQQGRKTRLTAEAGVNGYPVWTPDGQFVVFQSSGQLAWARADGSEQTQPLTKSVQSRFPSSFTPDGKRLLFVEQKPGGGSQIASLPVSVSSGRLQAGDAQTFRELSSGSLVPMFSPDGRWVAYASAESGRYEVYVRAFPDSGRQWLVSAGGGNFPVWSRKANELFYRSEDQAIMVTGFKVTDGTFVPDKPRLWSETRLFNTGFVQNFDLVPDASRFAILVSAEAPAAGEADRQVTLMLNFFEEVRRRLAAAPR